MFVGCFNKGGRQRGGREEEERKRRGGSGFVCVCVCVFLLLSVSVSFGALLYSVLLLGHKSMLDLKKTAAHKKAAKKAKASASGAPACHAQERSAT